MDNCHDIARAVSESVLIQDTRPRRAVLVLGVSRSGTSLVTHVLHALGAALPHDLLGAAHGNPLGHFEPLALVALNDRILESLNQRWDDPRPIPAGWFRSRQAYEFLRHITAQVRRSYGDASLFVIKDPRLCRLVPLYLDALDVLDIEPLVVLQVRPVAEVIQSLVDRDNMQPALAELLWLRSVVDAERQTRDCRRVWISMGEMIRDWPKTICRIADGLCLQWPMNRNEAFAEVTSLLKPRMFHRAEAPLSPDCGRWLAAATWAASEHGLAGDESAARTAFDLVRTMLHDFDRICEPHLAEIASMRESWSWRVTAPLRALRRGKRRNPSTLRD